MGMGRGLKKRKTWPAMLQRNIKGPIPHKLPVGLKQISTAAAIFSRGGLFIWTYGPSTIEKKVSKA